jgi:imidazole glycerol-phosphate synthase subunit HisF
MLKKRIIFTLLYDNGNFMLSRNFRLQKVGDLEWLQTNYNFSHISFFIDELIILNVSRGEKNQLAFLKTLKNLTESCFVPIAAGGGVRSLDDARSLLRSGADKVVVNTSVFSSPELLYDLANNFGQQCVVASLDIKKSLEEDYKIIIESGSKIIDKNIRDLLNEVQPNTIGEVYLNSIDQDGTGQGYDLNMLNLLPLDWSIPVILSGGAGNASHMKEGLSDNRVDAVATAHLFNFVGDGIKEARKSILSSGYNLASWPTVDEFKHNLKKEI